MVKNLQTTHQNTFLASQNKRQSASYGLLYVFSGFMCVIFLGGAAISLSLNAEFGYVRAGELGRWVAILCDLFKIGLSASLFYLRTRSSRALTFIGLLAFSILSVFSTYGYYITRIEGQQGTKLAEKQAYQVLTRTKKQLENKLSALGEHRPLTVIAAEIAAYKAHKIYKDPKRSDQCQNATIEASEVFCAQFHKLESEYLLAQDRLPKRAKLKVQIKKLEDKLDTIDVSVVSQRLDPFASSFGQQKNFNIYFNLFLAGLIEIATITGLPLSLFLFEFAKEVHRVQKMHLSQKTSSSLPLQDHQEVQSCPTLASEEHTKTLKNKHDGGVHQFLMACYIFEKGAMTPSTEVFAQYRDWCDHQLIDTPLGGQQFGKTMKIYGFIRKRKIIEGTKQRRMVYEGLCPSPLLRKGPL